MTSFSDYASFKGAIANWLNRTDLGDAVADFIVQAEATLNKVLRTRYMIVESNPNLTVNAGQDRVAVPGDLIDILYVVDTADATHTLVKQVPDWMARQQRLRLKTPGVPLYYAIIGGNMLVCPVPAANTSYKVSYYQEIPPLTASNPSNWVLAHHPDLYLYTALMHAAPYLADDARTELFGQSIVKMVQSLIANNQTTTLEGQDYNEFKG
jgi:hypothetical protein